METTPIQANRSIDAENILQTIESLTPVFEGVLGFISSWWWVPLPFLLWPHFVSYYLLWREHMWDLYKRPKSIILEVRPPSDIEKPIRAMETVLHGFWQIYGPPNWYEKWIVGEQDLSFSLEIAGIDGVPHFLVRLPKPYRNLFESHIYSQYGEAEIYEVDDYVKNVPPTVPNERWDFLGCGYRLTAPEYYPIKTYKEFETEQEEQEEKVDPIAGLMEGIAKLEKGEQIWIQIKAKPVATENDGGFLEKAEAEKAKFLSRKVAKKSEPKSIFGMFVEFLVTSKVTLDESKEEEPQKYSPELTLSPGERRKIDGLERKISKKYFKCHVHHIYISRKDVIHKPNFRIPMSYFNNFGDGNSNSIIPYGKTITKPSQNWYDFFWFQERRKYLSKRKFIRNYIRRTPMFYPNVLEKTYFILNAEELATLFHFPSRIAAPPSILERVESKKAEAPWGLPTE